MWLALYTHGTVYIIELSSGKKEGKYLDPWVTTIQVSVHTQWLFIDTIYRLQSQTQVGHCHLVLTLMPPCPVLGELLLVETWTPLLRQHFFIQGWRSAWSTEFLQSLMMSVQYYAADHNQVHSDVRTSQSSLRSPGIVTYRKWRSSPQSCYVCWSW